MAYALRALTVYCKQQDKKYLAVAVTSEAPYELQRKALEQMANTAQSKADACEFFVHTWRLKLMTIVRRVDNAYDTEYWTRTPEQTITGFMAGPLKEATNRDSKRL